MDIIHFDEKFWIAVSFIILLLIIYKPLKSIIISFLDKYISDINKKINEAASLKKEAEEMFLIYQKKHEEFTRETKEMILNTQEHAESMKVDAKINLEKFLEKRSSIAMQKIASYESSIVSNLKNRTIEITIAAILKLLGEKLTPDIAKQLVNSSIDELNKKIN